MDGCCYWSESFKTETNDIQAAINTLAGNDYRQKDELTQKRKNEVGERRSQSTSPGAMLNVF
jgi:hypothetical protein